MKNGIPDLEPPAAELSDFVRDPEIGLQRSLTRVLVMLAADSNAEVTSAATDAAASLGASVIGGLPEVGVMLFALPAGSAPEAVPALRTALLAVPGVEVASEDWAMQTDAVTEVEAGKALPSNDTNGASIPWLWEREPAGANAWLEQVRAPQAWNWNDAIERAGTLTAVGLLDGGCWSGHEELAPVVTTTPLPGNVNVVHATNCAGVLAAVASDKAGMTGMTPFARITSIGVGASSGGLALARRLVSQRLPSARAPHAGPCREHVARLQLVEEPTELLRRQRRAGLGHRPTTRRASGPGAAARGARQRPHRRAYGQAPGQPLWRR